MSTTKEALRWALSYGVVQSGISGKGRASRPKNQAIILYGHRISADNEGYLQGLRPSWFAQHVQYLTRHYEIIPLDHLVKCLSENKEFPTNSAVLTFDDGFRDNWDYAIPVLRQARAVATFFVVTGALQSGLFPWPQRIGYAFQRTSKSEMTLQVATPLHVNLRSPTQRWQSYRRVFDRLSTYPAQVREALIDGICAALDVHAPTDRMLTWQHVKQMHAMGMGIGAHSHSHSLLAKVPEEEAVREMTRSRDELRKNLGIARPSFAFPGGSLTPALTELAKELGFQSAFAPNRAVRWVTPQSDVYRLPRVGLINGPAMLQEAELDGPFHTLRNLYRGGLPLTDPLILSRE